MNYDWLGFSIVLVFGLMFFLGPWIRGISPRFHSLLLIGVIVHACGSLARHWMLYNLYDGIGDATGYYQAGLTYSKMIHTLDFSFFRGPYFANKWWGTQFVKFVSGFVIALIGPSMRAEFLFFSILSLIGIYLIVRAFHESFPEVRMEKYGRFLIFCPSLCFWPSSIGKDALAIFAIAFVVYGYVSKTGIKWIPIAIGLLISFCIRPHLAGLLVCALAAAHWTEAKRKGVLFFFQGILILAVGTFIAYQAMNSFGLEGAGVEDVESFVSKHTIDGRATVDSSGMGPARFAVAPINLLFRPFIWEGSGGTFLSALEVLVFWIFVWRRRKRISLAIRAWRQHRILRFTSLFSLLYIFVIGMVIFNFGILVRQRTLIIPFLLIWLEVPSPAQKTRTEEIEVNPAPLLKAVGVP